MHPFLDGLQVTIVEPFLVFSEKETELILTLTTQTCYLGLTQTLTKNRNYCSKFDTILPILSGKRWKHFLSFVTSSKKLWFCLKAAQNISCGQVYNKLMADISTFLNIYLSRILAKFCKRIDSVTNCSEPARLTTILQFKYHFC